MSLQNPKPESLIRHRPFLLYWSARTASAMAFQMLGVAVGWQMYALTGSALDLGLVGLAQFVPAVSLVLIAGNIADRYDRRVILQLCRGVLVLAAAALIRTVVLRKSEKRIQLTLAIGAQQLE